MQEIEWNKLPSHSLNLKIYISIKFDHKIQRFIGYDVERRWRERWREPRRSALNWCKFVCVLLLCVNFRFSHLFFSSCFVVCGSSHPRSIAHVAFRLRFIHFLLQITIKQTLLLLSSQWNFSAVYENLQIKKREAATRMKKTFNEFIINLSKQNIFVVGWCFKWGGEKDKKEPVNRKSSKKANKRKKI